MVSVSVGTCLENPARVTNHPGDHASHLKRHWGVLKWSLAMKCCSKDAKSTTICLLPEPGPVVYMMASCLALRPVCVFRSASDGPFPTVDKYQFPAAPHSGTPSMDVPVCLWS